MLRVAPCLLLLVLLTGCRELTHPKDGYIVVESTSSSVRIETAGLEGAGRVTAFTTDGAWARIFDAPEGSFVFDRALPSDAWHCDPDDGSQGCVALLRAGDDQGYLSVTGRLRGKIYVCTQSYVQKYGRKHCGERRFVKSDGRAIDEAQTVELSYATTQQLRSDDFLDVDASYVWRGDEASRWFSGSHAWRSIDSWHPPSTGCATDLSEVLLERQQRHPGQA